MGCHHQIGLTPKVQKKRQKKGTEMLKDGDKAPDFALPDETAAIIKLSMPFFCLFFWTFGVCLIWSRHRTRRSALQNSLLELVRREMNLNCWIVDRASSLGRTKVWP